MPVIVCPPPPFYTHPHLYSYPLPCVCVFHTRFTHIFFTTTCLSLPRTHRIILTLPFPCCRALSSTTRWLPRTARTRAFPTATAHHSVSPLPARLPLRCLYYYTYRLQHGCFYFGLPSYSFSLHDPRFGCFCCHTHTRGSVCCVWWRAAAHALRAFKLPHHLYIPVYLPPHSPYLPPATLHLPHHITTTTPPHPVIPPPRYPDVDICGSPLGCTHFAFCALLPYAALPPGWTLLFMPVGLLNALCPIGSICACWHLCCVLPYHACLYRS